MGKPAGASSASPRARGSDNKPPEISLFLCIAPYAAIGEEAVEILPGRKGSPLVILSSPLEGLIDHDPPRN
jgi:hypothetical protein